ncbi:MAG: exodeoxyribonuclease V subunit beta [Lautropia sp.]|nr:exodeoxyribonuclease V subunit beta [Lautropia sp.]
MAVDAAPVERVEPLRFPLQGSRLIEASAGTGKTYTIAALYLRLVLGHGGPDTCFQRPLDPPEILVVTFTEAATLELRDRIRTRLAEAAAFFREDVLTGEAVDRHEPAPRREESDQDGASGMAGTAMDGQETFADFSDRTSADDGQQADSAAPRATDPILQQLRDSYAPEQWADCAVRLQLAAEWMDEASISTIHGWCNRMLREHAFDSGGLFTQTLATDTSELLAEAVRDYWRTFCYSLSTDAARRLQGWWADPAALQRAVDALQSSLDGFDGIEARPPAEAIAEAAAERRAVLSELKAPWRGGWIDELRRLLFDAIDKKQINGLKLRRNNLETWLTALGDWAADDDNDQPPLDLKSKAYERLTKAGMRDAWKNGEPPDHPAFEAIPNLPARLQQLPDGRIPTLLHAARWIDRRHEAARRQRGELSFDDLLLQLEAALDGPGGEELAARIRRQFPVALIDEFQDTDPHQYRIFDRVYHVADNASTEALILIGDPKQAIYAFRGADIFTYLQARHATEGRHYTLDTNFRASHAMVGAANHLFECAERRSGGGGAFRFAQGADDPVPFITVQSKGRSDVWWRSAIDGEVSAAAAPASSVHQTPPALTIWYPDALDQSTDQSQTQYLQTYAQATAVEIARLLQAGRQGRAGFGQSTGVRPADVAVIVHTGRQAARVRRALAARGIRSVYLSDDESVFNSPVVSDLLRWLRACAEPGDGRLLRAALGTTLSGLSSTELHELTTLETIWEARVQQFQSYRQVWRRQGVLPMIRHLLRDFGVAERLLAAGDERQLTDLLHLSELLQQAATLLDGEQALIRHLSEQRKQPEGSADARRQRLESDDERVRVVTVHKSKGLEYPLVFLPYVCHVRTVKTDDGVLRWHDGEGRLRSCPGGPEQAQAQQRADEERLGEDLRKLYVALTRARHATWIGMAATSDLADSAIGHLLGFDEQIEDAEQRRRRLRACLEALVAGAPAGQMVLCAPPLEDSAGIHVAAVAAGPAPGGPMPLTRAPWPHWWIASYSALSAGVLDQARRAAEGREGGDSALVDQVNLALDERHFTASALEETWAEQANAGWGAGMVQPARVQGYDGFDAFSDAAFDEAMTADTDDGRPGRVYHEASVPTSDLPSFPAAGLALHTFARGPRAGTLLHGLLEWMGRQGFGELAAAPERIDEEIGRRLRRLPEWREWQPLLSAWLRRLIGQRWRLRGDDVPDEQADPPGEAATRHSRMLRLADLRQYQCEMAFMLPAQHIELRQLDAWVRQHTLAGVARPALPDGRLNGMLKGFIDLVFEHRGRYFVLDYKSNWLGEGAQHYTLPTMRQAVIDHRYELQYLFYLLALHRLLKTRLPDYDYDRHVGGALYLFLRGVQAPGGGLFQARPDRTVIEALDAAFAGRQKLSVERASKKRASPAEREASI